MTISRVLICLLVIVHSSEALCVGRRKNSTCVSLRERVREILFFKTVCYARLGCFYSGPPWYHPVHRPISLPPQSPDVLLPRFLLYTRRNRYRPIFLEEGNVWTLEKSPFNPKAVTRLIIHGYLDSIESTNWMLELKDAFLNVGDDNVIIFDWSGGNRILYAVATANTRTAGALLGNFILFLMKETWIKPEQVHLIGHSLGAEIAGYAGSRVKNIGRISGIEPAGPNFNYMPPEVVLDSGDALFVDNLHTDQGQVIVDGLGSPQDDGDVDFWPWNGEIPLPVCTDRLLESIAQLYPTQLFLYTVACRHFAAVDLYVYSFNQSNCLFIGVRCRSWEAFLSGLCDCGPKGEECKVMGFFARPTPNRVSWQDDSRYYLKTGLRRPFCVHQYVLNIYIHNLYPIEKEKYDDFPAEITLEGLESKLKTGIKLSLSARSNWQKLSFLLTNEKPLGSVHYGVIHFHSYSGNSSEHSRKFENSRYILKKLEVTYLYPLPKTETSFLLCMQWKCPEGACENFMFKQEFCYAEEHEKAILQSVTEKYDSIASSTISQADSEMRKTVLLLV